jgi:hypothetical protein
MTNEGILSLLLTENIPSCLRLQDLEGFRFVLLAGFPGSGLASFPASQPFGLLAFQPPGKGVIWL